MYLLTHSLGRHFCLPLSREVDGALVTSSPSGAHSLPLQLAAFADQLFIWAQPLKPAFVAQRRATPTMAGRLAATLFAAVALLALVPSGA